MKKNGIENGNLAQRDGPQKFQGKFEATPLRCIIFAYVSYAIAFGFGVLRTLLLQLGFAKDHTPCDPNGVAEGFAPLYPLAESFYFRYLYNRARGLWNRPVCSTPCATIDIAERKVVKSGWRCEHTGRLHKNVVNLSSYNYLGFAESSGPCAETVKRTVKDYGVGTCSARQEIGNLDVHERLEKEVARFLGVESCLAFGMGFATNSTNIPCLVDKDCLILSDELNHASLVLGCRLSEAFVVVFKHNDLTDLETKLRSAVVCGHPRTHKRWKKILIVVEGLYSMEGSIVNLPGILALKAKYGAYIYMDEAHSIGALGKKGRGVTEYFGVSARDVDVMMGTFTKSFGSAGGYIAGASSLVEHLRHNSHSACYAGSMSPPVCMQILASLRIITDSPEGLSRMVRLADNVKHFRCGLREMGFILYGNDDSPVVPMMIYIPTHLWLFSRAMLRRGFAVVVVGFPVTTLIESRARFCVSANHSKEQLELALTAISEIGDLLGLKYSRKAGNHENNL